MSKLKNLKSGVQNSDIRFGIQSFSASGAIDESGGNVVIVATTTDLALTLTPKAGQVWVFTSTAAPSSGTTVTLGGSFTWDGTNEIATIDAANETLVVVFNSSRAIVLSNDSSIAFSSS